jgi:hypothetical protein
LEKGLLSRVVSSPRIKRYPLVSGGNTTWD